jgi:hypothetical protein
MSLTYKEIPHHKRNKRPYNTQKKHKLPIKFLNGKSIHLNEINEPGTVAHICNPSYSGGRNGENHDPRPAQAKS